MTLTLSQKLLRATAFLMRQFGHALGDIHTSVDQEEETEDGKLIVIVSLHYITCITYITEMDVHNYNICILVCSLFVRPYSSKKLASGIVVVVKTMKSCT